MQRNEPDEPTLCRGGTERLLSLANEYLKMALRIESQFLSGYEGDGDRAIDTLRVFTDDVHMGAEVEFYWRPFREVYAAVAAGAIMRSQHDLAAAMALAMGDDDRERMKAISDLATRMSRDCLSTTVKVQKDLAKLAGRT